MIEPADVYERVGHLQAVAGWLALLVALQIVAKVVIFGWVVSILKRVERLLSLVETHGAITDRVLRGATREVKEEVRQRTAEVPSAVVEEIARAAPVVVPWREGVDRDRRQTGQTPPDGTPRPTLPFIPPEAP